MKARLVPLYFSSGKDSDFDKQLQALRKLLSAQADILEPVRLGDPLPPADAVLFPQILGEAYRRLADFKAIALPILIITTPSGTLSMWDWEIVDFLRACGVQTIAPYDPAFTAPSARPWPSSGSCGRRGSSSSRTTPARGSRPRYSSGSTVGGPVLAADEGAVRRGRRETQLQGAWSPGQGRQRQRG